VLQDSGTDCRQPFRYAPERPTTDKVRVARQN